MSSEPGVLIREMSLADIPSGLRLCRSSGWNQTEEDWRHFLTTAPHGALVAIEDERVIGSVATLPFGAFAWISMVLVDPAARRRGIGTLLLNRGLALIPDDVVARLDATPAGEVVYRKLGFVAEYGLARLFLDAPAAPKRSEGGPKRDASVRPLRSADWPTIREIDARVFGASRATLLERLADEAPEYAWVMECDGRLRGYVLGRRGHLRDQIGPLIADDEEIAGILLDACLGARRECGVFVDALDDHRSWRATLTAHGFAIQRPFLRMYRGQFTTPGQPSRIFAITGPEFG